MSIWTLDESLIFLSLPYSFSRRYSLERQYTTLFFTNPNHYIP